MDMPCPRMLSKLAHLRTVEYQLSGNFDKSSIYSVSKPALQFFYPRLQNAACTTEDQTRLEKSSNYNFFFMPDRLIEPTSAQLHMAE